MEKGRSRLRSRGKGRRGRVPSKGKGMKVWIPSREKGREADNHAKEARSTRKAGNHAKEARSKEEAENHAQEGLYTHNSRADSNGSNNSPKTGERSCVTARDKRRKRIHADPVPEMDPDPDPDPGPRRHLTDIQEDGNEGILIALRGLQTSPMNGGPAKNGGFPQFDGTSMGYLRFKQRWKTFQEFYHTSTLESELVYMLRDRCMKKEMADKIRQDSGCALSR